MNLENNKGNYHKEGRGISNLEQRNTAYASMSMLYSLDKNVGHLIDKLRKKGLYVNTIIVFASDNGGLSRPAKNRTQNAPTAVLLKRENYGFMREKLEFLVD